MCGFVGFSSQNKEKLRSLQALIKHRGPDAQGEFFTDQVSLGHNRLSIIDLSKTGAQPMQSGNGDFVIVFNGEIYNYAEIKKELENLGCHFRGGSDTEVILQGYERWGAGIFSRLRGMWALAIFNKKKNEIVLSRDFFGIKPLYYSLQGGELHFASELKVLRKSLPGLTPNTEMYYQFFNFGYFIDPYTCYREVKKLGSGTVLTYNLSSKEVEIDYIDFVNKGEAEYHEDFNDAVDELDKVMLDSVQAHYVSDVPVGLLLSGGNDSSLLAALSVASGQKPIAYNINIQNSLDSKYARKVAKHLGLELRETAMDPKILAEQYDKIWDFVDEPTADSSVIPTSLVYSTIAQDTKVVLSGEGGDEMFGGYRRHEVLWRHQRLRENNKLFEVLNALQGEGKFSLNYLNPILTRLRNTYLSRSNDAISAYLSTVSLSNRSYEYKKIRKQLYGMTKNKDFGNLFFDRFLYLPNDLMYKNDISSMASSIEARVPFLDKVLYNIVSSLIGPKFCLSKKYQNKLILKKVMEKYLPQELIYRSKKGFSFSFEKYKLDSFYADAKKALRFHYDNADVFALPTELLSTIKKNKANILIKKYPNFVFALVSNWKIFK